jgi:hypothetical protein
MYRLGRVAQTLEALKEVREPCHSERNTPGLQRNTWSI